MGHKIKRKVFTLRFDGHEDLDGASVRVRSVSLGRLLAVAEQAEAVRNGAGISEVRELLDLFCSRLESWDLEEEDGTPIPSSIEGLLSLEPDVALDIVLSWADVLISVKADGDLGKDSISGPQFPEASIPMAVA